MPACGARTKVCVTCGHHLSCHKAARCVTRGPKAACKRSTALAPAPCQAFAAKPCTQSHVMPNGRCYLHGGRAPVGAANGQYQGKGFSVALPRRMQADYDAARNDPARLSLDDEMAELRALRRDLWRLMEGDAFLAVAQVRAAADAIHKAYQQAFLAHRNSNAEKFAEAMTALGGGDQQLRDALSPVAAMEAARATAADLAVKVERLARTENARLVEERGMLSLEACMATMHTLVVALLGAVSEHVREPEVQKALRRAVGAQFARLVGRRDAPPADADRRVVDVPAAEYSAAVD